MTTSNSDDATILNIASHDDDSLLLLNSNFSPTHGTMTSHALSISHLRLTNILRGLLFLEFILFLIIWFIGSQNHSLVDDIVNFQWTASIFDIVAISMFKLIFLVVFLTEREALTIRRISNFGLIAIALGTLLFAIIKFVVVVQYSTRMSRLYLSCIYLFLIFSSLEFIGILSSFSQAKQDQSRITNDEENPANLRRIFSLIKHERCLMMAGTFFLLISSGIEIIDILLFGEIIGLAVAQKPISSVNRVIVILISLDFIASVSTFLYSWLFNLVGQKMTSRLRRHVFQAIIKQEIAFFDENRTGELTNRLSSDAQAVESLITENMATLIQNSIHIMGSLVVMFYLEVTLTFLLMILVPVVVLIALNYGEVVENLRKTFQDKLAEAGTVAEESISSMRTVRIFGAEEKIISHYQNRLSQSFTVGKKLALNDGLFSSLLELLVAASISAVMWYGGKLIFDKKLSTGTLSAFLLYMIQVAVDFGYLASLYAQYMQAMGASRSIFHLLDRRPKIPSTANDNCSVQPTDFDGSVRFDQVSFTYPTRPMQQVLKNISFSLKPGQKVAIVGPSGGGKSTIVSLIEQFYEPECGTIYLSSHPLFSIDPQWLRRHVSLVNQEPSLFACSIRENIAFGLDHDMVSLDEIVRVAQQANAHQFIDAFPDKYDTLVGERGLSLSGGQRQRIAIARALLMNPRLLLLDEATSALDAESEHLIDEAIERAMVGRTVLVIAHRLSTVRNADLVLVLDQGSIVEQGTHDSLINQEDGIYKKLALRQLISSAQDA